MRNRSRASALALVLCAGPPAVAQQINGRVVDAGTGTPVGAGFLVLINEAGQEVSRSLAARDGSFIIRPGASGRYRLRSERIAFRSVTTEWFTVPANAAVPIEVRVSALPKRLDPISVTDSTECVLHPEEGRRVATLWGEALKALHATAWTAREGTVGFRIEKHRRELDRNLGVRDETLDTVFVTTAQPFITATAATLLEEGFVRREGREVVFEGLDAQVFLSRPFLNTHCFLARSAEHDSVVGIAFQPVVSRTNTEVSGVLWLDADNYELRSLEFEYVGLPTRWPRTASGGRTDFVRLADGRWIVWRWYVRVPRFDPRRLRPRLTGYVEDGARVLSLLQERRDPGFHPHGDRTDRAERQPW